jgi:hypothetical protein
VVKQQPNKCTALSSNPSIPKRKNAKITRIKRAEGVVQVLKHLPCKHEDLSSNPTDAEK